jgi:hypothetical protein
MPEQESLTTSQDTAGKFCQWFLNVFFPDFFTLEKNREMKKKLHAYKNCSNKKGDESAE